jgi:nitrite reductase (NADH) small subunit
MMTSGRVVYNLGPLDRLPRGEGRTFLVEKTMVAIFRTRKDDVYALQAQCSHKGGPLADGIIGNGTVICPLHSFKFCLMDGQPVGNSCASLKTYVVSVDEYGNVLLQMNE